MNNTQNGYAISRQGSHFSLLFDVLWMFVVCLTAFWLGPRAWKNGNSITLKITSNSMFVFNRSMLRAQGRLADIPNVMVRKHTAVHMKSKKNTVLIAVKGED